MLKYNCHKLQPGEHMKGISTIVAIIVIVVIVVGGALIAYYLNLTKQVFIGGWEVTAVASKSYTGSTSAGRTDVTLNTGHTTRVGWDGKAVAVVATVQKFWGIKGGPKYYARINYAYGTKGSEPWWILPGDCYKACFRGWSVRKASQRDSETLEMEVEKETAFKIELALKRLGLKVSLTPSGKEKYVIRVKVGLYDVYASALFNFVPGSKGWFGNCEYDYGRGFYKAVWLKALLMGP